MLCLLACSHCGCAARRNDGLLEGRLREQGRILSETESKLKDAESELAIARRESDVLRQQLAADGKSPILPEQADTLFRATGIKINKLLSGSLDRDGKPGDELLTAVIVPHDADGEPVKLPGEVRLELFDLTRPGEQNRIGEWKFDASEAREQWHSGFLASGYLFRLPWQTPPLAGQVVLHAHLKTADGREFETSSTIDITPPVSQAGHETPAASQDSKLPRLSASEPKEFFAAPGSATRPIETSSPKEQDIDWESQKPAGDEGASPKKFPLRRGERPAEFDPSDAEPATLAEPLRTSDSWTIESIPRVH